MKTTDFLRCLRNLLVSIPLFMVLGASSAMADLISTQEALYQYDREALIQLINTEESRQQMLAMGVDPDKVNSRLSSLTNAELTAFNQQLQEAPAGSGAAGVILTVFIVFVITDMLCATDIFGFVNCIN